MNTRLGETMVGPTNPPYFIADIAANHDGDIDRAFRLIELAKESGANAAKFQHFQAEKIVCDSAFSNMSNQLSHQANWNKSVYDVYKDASISQEWTSRLKKKCDDVGVTFLTSPYDFQSVDHVDPYLSYYKIGSGDITWCAILEHIASKGKPVVLATGASSIEDVRRAVGIFNKNTLILMQCNTNYTANHANMKYINLNVLLNYQKEFPHIILGLSDHTQGHVSVLGAIALGARVIEKHFTDDKSRIGPDHKFSTTPFEWRKMVDDAKDLYAALGDGVKKVEGNETETHIIQRRSLYYTSDLHQGKIFSSSDFVALRPVCPDGLLPYQDKIFIGCKLKNHVFAGQPVRESDFN